VRLRINFALNYWKSVSNESSYRVTSSRTDILSRRLVIIEERAHQSLDTKAGARQQSCYHGRECVAEVSPTRPPLTSVNGFEPTLIFCRTISLRARHFIETINATTRRGELSLAQRVWLD